MGWTIPQDSVARLYSPAEAVIDHPRMAGPYPRSVLLVSFEHGTSIEERQAAFDLVEGRVIGGFGSTAYVVVIDGSADGERLWRAVDCLRMQPRVGFAAPDVITGRTEMQYVRPHDGPGIPSSWESRVPL